METCLPIPLFPRPASPPSNRLLHWSSLLLLAAGIALGAAGCAGSGGIDTRRPLTPDDVMRHVEAKNAETFAVSATGKISIDSPELSNTGNLAVNLLKPDSVYIEVTGPFGVSAVKGLVTRREFTFYNGLENTVLTGRTTSGNLRNVLRVAIDFDDIMQILAGTSGFSKALPGITPEGSLQDDVYRIVWRGPKETVEYEVDTRYEAVRRYQRRSESGDILEEITYKDFRRMHGRYRPNIIALSRPPSEESLVIIYDRQVINDLPMDFSFKIPTAARRIVF